MNWAEMTAEQRDRLVAEQVMGWQAKECDGEIGELPISPDGWFCQKCGYSGSWGDDTTHEELPARYTQSLDTAWLVVRYMNQPQDSMYDRYARFIEEIERLLGSDMFFDLFYCDKNEDHLTPERICLAALKACGEGENIELAPTERGEA